MPNKLAKKRMGRPSRCVGEVRAKVLGAFRASPSFAVVSGATGIPENALRRWVNLGRDGDEFYLELYLARQESLAASTAEMLDIVQGIARGGEGQPALNAASKWLAWFNPEECSDVRTTNVKVTNADAEKDDATRQKVLASLTDDELALLDRIETKRLAAENEDDIEDADFEEA